MNYAAMCAPAFESLIYEEYFIVIKIMDNGWMDGLPEAASIYQRKYFSNLTKRKLNGLRRSNIHIKIKHVSVTSLRALMSVMVRCWSVCRPFKNFLKKQESYTSIAPIGVLVKRMRHHASGLTKVTAHSE